MGVAALSAGLERAAAPAAAAERDQAAIDRWVKERWPQILQTPNGAEPV
jgi:hypothetical protein